MLKILFLSSLCLPLYAAENSTITAVKGDVFLLSTSNRWERVYENEKFNYGIRIKTEKDSSAVFNVNNSLQIVIGENSTLELNDMFSDRSNMISLALFNGKFGFVIHNGNKKIYINTPFSVIVGNKGKFGIEISDTYIARVDPQGAVLYYLSEKGETRIAEPVSIPASQKFDYKLCAKSIDENIERLRKHISEYDKSSEDFEALSEKVLASRKNEAVLKKQLGGVLRDIFDILLHTNEAKNRINIFSTLLRQHLEEDNLLSNGYPVEEINSALEELRTKQDTISNLKGRYNNIVGSELYSILKVYDSIMNGKKKR